MIDIDKSLEIAKDAALLAGKFLISANNDTQKILGDDGRDIKLQIDQDAENLITKYISTRSNLPILGEEFGHKGNLGSAFWVIDPLDGTSNYFRNIPICAVSIALMHNNEPILGVINDFFSENLYFASKEKGAFVNNKRINVSKPVFDLEKERVFQNSSAFILSSFSEGLPMAALEAMSYGIPCLLSENCNLPETFKIGAAIKTNPSVDEIIKSLKYLIKMKDKEKKKISKLAYDYVSLNHNWSRITSELNDLYRSVCEDI